MLIVADSSPLISFAIIDQLELLNKIYDRVLVPQAVYNEVTQEDKPFSNDIKKFLENNIEIVNNRTAVDILNDEIDLGESEAIVLALEKGIKAILIDDNKGRKRARLKGLKVIGTLGTLIRAKNLGYINEVKPLMDKLTDYNIRISKELYKQVLEITDEI